MSEVRERAGGEATAADRLWDDWDTPPRVPSAPELHLDGFEGPLDMLLDLVERQRIDLGRISILAVVEQFVAAMARYAERVTLERRADWLVMTSRLLLLRTRLCFPASPKAKDDAEREARREVDRIEAVRLTRAAATWLDARPQVGRDVFVRPHGPGARVTSYMDLMEACLAILQREKAATAAADSILHVRPATLFPVADVLAAVRRQLAELDAPVALELLVPAIPDSAADRLLAGRAGLSSTLMAALELGRIGEAILVQEHRTDPLLVGAGRPD